MKHVVGLFFIFTLLGFIQLNAQNVNVTGVVTDAMGPLPGVSIIVKGTTTGTVSNEKGKYTISAKVGDWLEFSFIGYSSKKVKVGSQHVINVNMEEDSKMLDELVVVGYGYQRKSDVATSVTTVKTDEMLSYPAGNVAEMLRGRAAGVTVTSTSGRPGSTPSIKIRGTRSISASNDPLYVIDGTPASANEFAALGAEDIESIEILKDAASQAIYGARASDGVILITTKRGKAGKTEVSYNAYVGVQTLWRNFDFYSPEEFYALRAEAKAHDMGIDDASQLTDEYVLADDIMLKSWRNKDFIDWEDAMLDNALSHNHELSVKTGTDKLRIATSANYYNQEGMVVTGSRYQRASFRLNADLNITKWLSIGVNSSMSLTRTDREQGSFNQYITRPPIAQIYNEDGTYAQYVNSAGEGNPFYQAEHYQRKINSDSYRLNFFMDIKPFKGFNYRFNASKYEYIQEDKEAKDKDFPGGGASANISENRTSDWLIENIITYEVPFTTDKHRLTLTGVQSLDHSLDRSLGYGVVDLPVDMGPDFIANGQFSGTPERSYSERNLASFMLRAQYSLLDRYMLNLAVRMDGSSRFGKNNKWGTFPSAAFAWRLNQEEFLRDVSWLDNLKFRLSYGIVGNQGGIGNYTTLGLVNGNPYEFGDEYYMGYIPGSTLSNPNLKWERSATTNVGFDFSIFKNRLNGTIEYYNTHTSDLLVNRQLNSSLGYTSMLDNLGKTKSQGMDISLNGDIIRTKDLVWNLGTNFSWFKNEIVKIDDQVDEFGNPASQPGNNWFIGESINVYYDYKADGIFQYEDFNKLADGTYELKPTIDTNGDGIADKAIDYQNPVEPGDVRVADIDGDGVITGDDRIVINRDPDYTASITSSLTWKGFELFMDWYGVFGTTRLNDYLHSSNQGGSLQGKFNGIKVNYWTPQNPSNEFPRPSVNATSSYKGTLAYQDASYIRLRTLQLAYNFPKKWISHLSLSKLRMYVTATNLLTFTDYLSYSPELATGDYPEGRQFVFGINVSF
ncbi:SusC/RagA family TonB-linked outer membrane protein [Bacteroides sp.]|uniref:SusC/RagA family TonB-linked outer membrane protein n=1 Tax=Bacteroides sp. TaxID=29523 RepID=UPI002584A7C6|nr:TonB-dependent receptor [Bacteroides sp.]